MEAVKNSPPMKRPLSAVHANARKSCCAIGTLNQPGAQHENAGKPQPAPPFSCRTLSSTRSATPPAADVIRFSTLAGHNEDQGRCNRRALREIVRKND